MRVGNKTQSRPGATPDIALMARSRSPFGLAAQIDGPQVSALVRAKPHSQADCSRWSALFLTRFGGRTPKSALGTTRFTFFKRQVIRASGGLRHNPRDAVAASVNGVKRVQQALKARARWITEQRELDPVAGSQMTAAEIEQESALLELFSELNRAGGFGNGQRDDRRACDRFRRDDAESTGLKRVPQRGGIGMDSANPIGTDLPDRGRERVDQIRRVRMRTTRVG